MSTWWWTTSLMWTSDSVPERISKQAWPSVWPGAASTSTASWKSFWPSLAITSWSLRMSKLRQTVFTMFGSGFLSRFDLEKSGFGPRQKSYSSWSR